MNWILNILLGAGLAAVNAGIIYLSKKQPLEFDGLKFSRSVGVAAVVALIIGFIPNITTQALGVVSVYGGFLIEKLYLLIKRRLEDGVLTIKIN